MRISAPRIELGQTFGIGHARPRISWKLDASDEPVTAIEAELTDGARVHLARLDPKRSILAEWPFAPLRSRQRVSLRLRPIGERHPGEFGEAVEVEAGLLERGDWAAQFVSPIGLGAVGEPAPVLHRTVMVTRPVVSARLYATSLGINEITINGRPVSDERFAPGWTVYPSRLRYRTFDVTSLIEPGPLDLRATIGNGWFRGQLVWPDNRAVYGERLALLAQLELQFEDGSTRTVGTDERWRARRGVTLEDDFYDGEVRDLSIATEAHSDVPVEVIPYGAALVASDAPEVGEVDRLAPAGRTRAPSGAMIVDFGQNLAGHVELKVRGSRGAEVVVRHAEVLQGDGELAMRPLRSARATCRYVLSGEGTETLAPSFTYSGFRYASVELVGEVELESLQAVVVSSRLDPTGTFRSSDPRLNRLHENVVWSMRGNFVGLPTDCPQRDERLGWTGDIQVFAPTANFLADTHGFLAEWLRDLLLEQEADGSIPSIVPNALGEVRPAAAGWGDAATIVPWSLWMSFADRELLARHYPSMRAWLRRIGSEAEDGIWRHGGQFGDWLDPSAPPDNPEAVRASPLVVGTAYYAKSAGLAARTAEVLGLAEDARELAALRERIIAAFRAAFVSPDGRIESDCPTVYALALENELLADGREVEGAGRRLVELVLEDRFRIATGFLGTPVLLDALCRAGREDVAMRVLMNEEAPSWLYAVRMGATTVWERWDALTPDGSINEGTMTSFNHYAYGAVADWMHRRLGGIEPVEAGYRHVRVAPVISDQLDWVDCSHESPYGRISVSWRRSADTFEVEVGIPAGCSAEIIVPGGAPEQVGGGLHRFMGRLS